MKYIKEFLADQSKNGEYVKKRHGMVLYIAAVTADNEVVIITADSPCEGDLRTMQQMNDLFVWVSNNQPVGKVIEE